MMESTHPVKITQIEQTKETNKELLNILSINMFIRPPGIKNNKSDYKDIRLQQFLENEIAKWDIIGFQELFGSFSSRRKKFLAKAKEKGLKYHAVCPSGSILKKKLVDGGVVILSKHPIVEYDFIRYTQAMQSDALAEKGAIYAKIKLHDELLLHVFNTHLQASYNSEKDLKNKDKYESIRFDQIQTLRKFIVEKTSNDRYPILVLGDFNVNGRKSKEDASDSEEYLKMMTHLSDNDFQMIDLLRDKYGQLPHFCVFNSKRHHPATVGDVTPDEDTPREVHLTKPEDQALCKRLDYIFWAKRKKERKNLNSNDVLPSKQQNNLEPEELEDSQEMEEIVETKDIEKEGHHEELVTVKKETCDIIPMFLEGEKCTQISDHYGVAVTLEYDLNKTTTVYKVEDAETSASTST